MALKKRLEDFEKAVKRLKDAYQETLKHKEDDYYTLNLPEMIDDRNITSHTYHEEVAEKIFNNLHIYLPLVEKVKEEIKERTKSI